MKNSNSLKTKTTRKNRQTIAYTRTEKPFLSNGMPKTGTLNFTDFSFTYVHLQYNFKTV